MEWKFKIESWLLDRQDEWVSWLSRYVQADSVQGNEEKAQEWVASKFRSMGLEVDMWEPDGLALKSHPYFYSPRDSFAGSPNVVGIWRGTGGGRSIILNGHTDVVPAGERVQWDEIPFSGAVKDGKLYGRGASDMKGGNVSSFLAVQCLKDLGVKLKGDVILQSVVEEESGGSGTLAALLRGYWADAAIIPEPTHMKIFPKQQGSMWFRIKIHGRSAHGGTRYEGVSAIDKSLVVIEAVRRLETRRNEQIKDPLYEKVPIPIPINVGVIHGGEWPSSVPDLVKLEGRMGIAPDETMESAKGEMAEALEQLNKEDPWFAAHPVQLEWFGARWVPGSIDVEHVLMNRLIVSYQQVMAKDPVIGGSPWGTDGGLLTLLGKIPTIVFGPGRTELAHFPNEYVELKNVRKCAEILALTLLDWCGIDE